MFFLSGLRGTGKTYVYKIVCHYLCSAGKIILCVASNGITLLLLLGGCTTHSTFHIPINTLNAKSLCNISKQDKQAEPLHVINLIIWDKALMQSHFTYCMKHLIILFRISTTTNTYHLVGKLLCLRATFSKYCQLYQSLYRKK